MKIAFHPLPTAEVEKIRQTGRDAYGLPVERHISTGGVYPCRHCLGEIPAGASYLILAHKPFASHHAFTETGPIFLCAEDCTAAEPASHVPDTLRADRFILRGYDVDERIIYGTGDVVPTGEIPAWAERLFQRPEVAFVDIRSAANNCFQCRIKRA